jgi:hypothetical protein
LGGSLGAAFGVVGGAATASFLNKLSRLKEAAGGAARIKARVAVFFVLIIDIG